MERKPQSLANHAKFDPPFHFFLAPVGLAFAIYSIQHAVRSPSAETLFAMAGALVLLVGIFKSRIYSLKVQDRLIRLEERIRMAQLLPADLQARIQALTESQIVALRFASDTELPALVRKTLDENLSNKQIKQAIQNWRPDYFRV